MTIRRVVLGLLSILLITLLGLLFIPRTYDAPTFQERAGTQYWDLPTGSHIGYTHIKSSSGQKRLPIIYLHGGPGGIVKDEVIHTLRPLADQGHDVYLYDQVGSGHSGRLSDISEYTIDRHLLDLKAIIELIGAERVILLGHSWGAVLATQYAADFPDQIARMVLDGPGPIFPVNRSLASTTPPDTLNLRAPAFTNRDGNQKAYNWRAKTIRKVAVLGGIKVASDREADRFFTYLNRELNKSTVCAGDQAPLPTGGGGFYAHLMTMKSLQSIPDKRAALEELDMPVLLIRGQCDNQNWGFIQEYLQLLPDIRLEMVENSGHSIVHARPDRYLELVSAFME